MMITTLKPVSLQEVVRGEVTQDKQEAVPLLTLAAAQGPGSSLGMLLERNGAAQDAKAARRYTLADQGHAGAQCHLGVFFLPRI